MKKYTIIAITFLGVLVLSLGFFATPVMKHARGLAWDTLTIATARVFGIKRISISDADIDTIYKLTKDNVRLSAELTDYRRLKDQLGTPAFDSLRKIPAAIVSRPLDTLSSKYIINKGISDGVMEGAPVVIMGSVLIGFTKELSAHTSVVETLFSRNTSVTVETVSRDEETSTARGLLQSKFQTSLEMNTIPRDANITVGQQVVTSNKEVMIPYGMIIGSIASLEKPENAAYQSAVVEVPYNIDSLDAAVVLVAP
ncbi:MAG: rod shape-determining protein MreC [bacterium]|nr:rod shape-determining protein MreC [bacterium]